MTTRTGRRARITAAGCPEFLTSPFGAPVNTNPPTDRPEVDDPRVLALAKERQQLANENPFNVVCPPWDGLTEQEQHLSLLDARSYLHAALRAGLVPAPVPVSFPPDQTLRDRIAEAIYAHYHPSHVVPLDGTGMGDLYRETADAVLAVLPPPADRAAEERDRYRTAWRSARERARAFGEGILLHVAQRDFWQKAAEQNYAATEAHRAAVCRGLADQQTQLAVADDLARRRDMAAARRQLVKELRRLAAEAQPEASPIGGRKTNTAFSPGEGVHGQDPYYDETETPQPDTETETPCGPAPDTCDAEAGEPCANHEREQAHAEGEHCFCGPECPDACTCADAGDCFVPLGHYRDCPAAAPEPHPTEADVRHALAVLDQFESRDAAPAAGSGRAADTHNDEEADRIVAYRSRDGRSLYCTRHAGEVFGTTFTPVTSEDLPDGGTCTYPECGADVLIPQEAGRG